MRKLIDFLDEQGNKAELESLRKNPDEGMVVKPSIYQKNMRKLNWIIALLDDLYEVEETGDNILLVKKSNNK